LSREEYEQKMRAKLLTQEEVYEEELENAD
jgi:hypothetical protein